MKPGPEQIDAILERIQNGESQAEIARSLGVVPATLHYWLAADEATIERSARARAGSAESWLDRGLEVLDRALLGEVDASAARAYEQACARRAAIRNPAYRDKQDLNHSGSIQLGLAAELAGLNK